MKGLKKRRRIQVMALAGAAMAGVLVILWFLPDEAFQFFRTPAEVAESQPAPEELFRVGGLVANGTVSQSEDGLSRFCIVDETHGIWVVTQEILPDLVEEGQAAVAQGRYDGVTFSAVEVLAKHDETYVPAELDGEMPVNAEADATLCPPAPI